MFVSCLLCRWGFCDELITTGYMCVCVCVCVCVCFRNLNSKAASPACGLLRYRKIIVTCYCSKVYSQVSSKIKLFDKILAVRVFKVLLQCS